MIVERYVEDNSTVKAGQKLFKVQIGIILHHYLVALMSLFRSLILLKNHFIQIAQRKMDYSLLKFNMQIFFTSGSTKYNHFSKLTWVDFWFDPFNLLA